MSYQKIGTHKYRVFVSDGFDLNGKRRMHTKTIKTKLKGKDLRLYIEKIERDLLASKKQEQVLMQAGISTFEDLAEYWLKHDKKRSSTEYNYRNMLNNRIYPKIGNFMITKLQPTHFLTLLTEISEEDISAKTVRNHYMLMNSIFKFAVDIKLLDKSPMEGLKPPRYKQNIKNNFYDEGEIKLLVEKLQGEPVRFVFATLLTLSTGIRRGELTGLQYKHINMDICTITIEQANIHTGLKGQEISAPKTEESNRIITYPESINQLLVEHRRDEEMKKQSSLWTVKNIDPDDDFIFTKSNGKPIYPNTIYQWWKRFTKRKGLRYITWHGLRHTSATYLLVSGINLANVSKRLGHSKTSTTSDIYTHAVESIDQVSSNIFNKKIQSVTKSVTNSEKITDIKEHKKA